MPDDTAGQDEAPAGMSRPEKAARCGLRME